VADGATEAYGSRHWARLLAKSWVRFSNFTNKSAFLELVGCLGDRAHQQWSTKPHSWYAEEKLRAGSFAAFIGLVIFPDENGISWQALSVGDCCLVQLRAGRVIASLPLSNPSEFSNRPTLLPSVRSLQETLFESVQVFDGSAQRGDTLLLMSDAVACWFLEASSSAPNQADEFQRLLNEGQTEKLDIFIDDNRLTTAMKNDDVAVIYIRVVD
jgi:hypothetical protein